MAQQTQMLAKAVIAGLAASITGAGFMGAEVSGAPLTSSQVLFDPDGNGGASGVRIGGLDWAPGNAVAVGGNQAVANFLAGTGPTTFEVLYQAKLVGYINPAGNTIQPDGIRNGTFEITAVARFYERVTGISSSGPTTSAAFDFVDRPGSFFEIWYDDTPNSGVMSGDGFRDGVRILGGSVDSASGIFEVTSTNPLIPLDSRPGIGGSSGAQLSVSGIGGTDIDVDVTDLDDSFFQTDIAALFFNTNNKLPFRETAPTQRFFNGVVPDLGRGNGLLPIGPQEGGPDILFQSDANNSFAVPEPGTMTLAVLALVGGMLAYGRRLRNAS